jgi:alginate O-acetyltransferase complex protein AlgI
MILDLLRKLPYLHQMPVYEVVLPIGISFYTFQAMSYVIDVYRKTCKPERNIIDFAAYISLFPQLIAGPIVRYSDVSDQLGGRKESLKNFESGIYLFLIGLSKKVLLANRFGALWASVSAAPKEFGVLGVWLGAFAYTFQIYFDFAGYSDMARGLGRMMGFEFCINFNYPYIAKTVTDFWRRWHISLSTWFRDYVYIPLGGNRVKKLRFVLNIMIVWSLTGLWHGAGLNFICWGIYYGVILLAEKLVLSKLFEKLLVVELFAMSVVAVYVLNQIVSIEYGFYGCMLPVAASLLHAPKNNTNTVFEKLALLFKYVTESGR